MTHCDLAIKMLNLILFILGSTLLAKLKRCPELIANTLSQLEEFFSKINVEYGPEIIQTWTIQEKKFIEEKNCKELYCCRHLELSPCNQFSIYFYTVYTLLCM